MMRNTRNEIQIFMEGEPASLLEIAEKSGDGKTWQSFLERHGHTRKVNDSTHRYLTGILGEYLSAREITIITNIKNPVLNEWRKRSLLVATKFKGKWYYSVNSLIETIAERNI